MTDWTLDETRLRDAAKELAFELPVNIARVANNVGVQVYSMKPADPASLTAMALQYPDGAKIYVNDALPADIKRWAIAKELAHIALSGDQALKALDAVEQIEQLKSPDAQTELASRQLAAAVLLPDASLRQAWAKTHDVSAVSALFFVPPEVVRSRLAVLGLVSVDK